MAFLRSSAWDLLKTIVVGAVYYFARDNCLEASLPVRVIVITLCMQIALICLGQLEKVVLPRPAPKAAKCSACAVPPVAAAAAATKN